MEEEREEGACVTSKWRDWEMEREWVWPEKGAMTWKLVIGGEVEERKERKRVEDVDGKVRPMRRMWKEEERDREERAKGERKEWERADLRDEGRKRRVLLVTCGSRRCWFVRKELRSRIGAEFAVAERN